jgi:hypothetical protein
VKVRKQYTFKNGTGRRNRGLNRGLSFKITEDMHDALIEYISLVDGIDMFPNLPKGAPYGEGLAHNIRLILADYLSRQLNREVLLYEPEEANA